MSGPLVTVVGEALVDVVRQPDGTERVHPGGSPANVAVGLARLGQRVELLTSYGDDEHGALVDAHLVGNDVRVVRAGADGATSVAEARLDATGAATYDFRIDWDPGDVSPDPSSVALHTGSIAAVLEPGAAAVRRMVDAARGRLTTCYDPNARPSLMGDPTATRGVVEELVAACDVVKVSDEDLAWLHPGRPDTDVARDWLASGPALVVVTRGERGAYGVTAAGGAEVPGVPVTAADTVGAGDAFTAGLLHGLSDRGLLGPGAREGIGALASGELAALLGRAAVVAALTVARPGADPPTLAELVAHEGVHRG